MKKEFCFVCIALFLLVFGTYISGALLVPYAKTLGGTGMSIGIIYSSMYVVRLLFGTPIGRISQKRGVKTILTYSLILYPLIAVAYWVSWNIGSLLAARLLHGFASAMLLPMAMAYMGEISPEGQEGRFMGVYNTILFVASATGPFAGGLIYDRYGIRQAFMTLFILALSSLVIILIFTRNNFKKVNGGAPATDMKGADKGGSLPEFRSNKRLLALSCVNIATAILLALLGASFTQLALAYNFSMSSTGMLIALYNIVIGIVQIPFGHMIDRCDKIRLTVLSGLSAALLTLLFPLLKSIWAIAVLIFILGIFTAINLAASSALSAALGKEGGMGGTMGFLGSANSAGTILGYLALGGIADLFGIRYTFYFTGIMFLAGIVLFYVLWKNVKILRHPHPH